MKSLALLGLLLAAPAAAQPALAPELLGRYAPAADCARMPRIVAGASGLLLETAAGNRPLPADISYSFGAGAMYEGIQVWALVRTGGTDRYGEPNRAILLTFNAGEKKGALAVDRIDDGPLGAPARLDPPLAALVQARILQRCR